MTDVPEWMSEDTFEYVLQFTEAHEGATNFMYNNYPLKSTSTDVTVGTGIALHSEGDAGRPDIMRLFVRKGTGAPASRDDMIQEYRRVARINRTASNLYTAFRDPSPLEIPMVFMRPSLRKKMLEFWAQRGNHPDFPDFATIPAQAQIALMSYNYGRRLSSAPRMCGAVQRGDYTLAAREAHVSGWDPQKNDAHKRLLLNAGIIIRDGLDTTQLPPLGRFKPPPMVIGTAEGDLSWLLGWWSVWDGNYYYYYFGRSGFVQYVKTKPGSSSPPPPAPLNQGTYSFTSDSNMVIDWNPADGGATRETFYNARRGVTEMNATSNRYSPLVAKKI